MNRCSVLRPRIDRKLPADEFQPFLHAGQAESPPFHCRFRLKTNPRITRRQFDLVWSTQERNMEVS